MDNTTFNELRKRVRKGEKIQEEIMRHEKVVTKLQSFELKGLHVCFTATNGAEIRTYLEEELAQLIADKIIAVTKKRAEQLKQEFNEL